MKDFKLEPLIRNSIKVMKPYASARDEFKEVSADLIFLDANENPFDNGINRYPDPQQLKVKSEISKLKAIPVNQILLGNGSDGVLDLIFRAFCEPNKDNVITLPPTYGMYEVLANLNAVNLIKIELDSDFEPKVDSILQAQNNQTKLLFLCSPNNPTSNSFNAETIKTLISEFNGIVIIDEAYIDFSIEESWIKQLDEFPNLIVIQTLSKAYGMAGIRLGMCFASEAIINVLNKIKPPYNINTLTQQKVIERLCEPENISKEINDLLQQRDWLKSELESITIIETIYPSDANFLLVKVDDATKRYKELTDKGIVVRNRSNQPRCDNCLRITIGTETENRTLITALKQLK
ncbi:MAG: histidinol-phosphate transaminase [Algicola sp.]|nr:histidinol-phosphate transaminase [Algicola sp.]